MRINTLTPLKLMVAGFVLAVVLVGVLVAGATRTTGGEEEPIVTGSVLTVAAVGRLAGYRLYRVDDHERQITCYAVTLGGMDCDRSFYRRAAVR
jgi:hypothetical protein